MKGRVIKAIIVFIAVALVIGLSGCGDAVTTKPPETGETYDPVFVENVTPKLQKMVDEGDMSQDSMDLIIERVKDGTYVRPDVQAILAGTLDPPKRGEEAEKAPSEGDSPATGDEPAYDEAWLANLTPQLEALVSDGKMEQEKMDEIIAKVKSGEYDRDDVRPILDAHK